MTDRRPKWLRGWEDDTKPRIDALLAECARQKASADADELRAAGWQYVAIQSRPEPMTYEVDGYPGGSS